MKKQILALSVMAASSLFADDIAYMQNGCCDPCPPVCCTPCCVPQPKKCINCEAYNPQWYDLQCACGFFVTVDFLYWYSRETNLSFASKYVALQNVAAELDNIAYPTRYFNFDAAWDPGFRVGLGWNMDCDGWDLYLNWTYYHPSEKNSASAASNTVWPLPGESSLFNPWSNGPIARATTPNWKRIHAHWSLTFNQIDLELGRKFWVSRCLNLRPYIGLRGGWTKTNFKTLSINNNSEPVVYTTTEQDFIRETETDIRDFQKSRNKFWGVGFTGGLQPNFMLGSFCGCGDWSIYGNVDASLIWGKFRGKRSVRSTYSSCDFDLLSTVVTTCEPFFNDTGSITASQRIYQMVPILDLGIGIRWEQRWCCDRYYSAIDLGWEHHVWFNHGTRNQANGDFFFLTQADNTGGIFQSDLDHPEIVWNFYNSTPSIVSDLVFGGLVIRANFGF